MPDYDVDLDAELGGVDVDLDAELGQQFDVDLDAELSPTPVRKTLDVDTGDPAPLGTNIDEFVEGAGLTAGYILKPFQNRDDNPIKGIRGPLATTANVLQDVGHGAAMFAEGTIATGGNPAGGAALVGADRFAQIHQEKGDEALKDPLTYVDAGVNTATAMIPGATGLTPLKKVATGVAIGAGGNAAVTGADLARQGINPVGKEGRPAMAQSMAFGAGVGMVPGVAAAIKPKLRLGLLREKEPAPPIIPEGQVIDDGLRNGKTEGQARRTGEVIPPEAPAGSGRYHGTSQKIAGFEDYADSDIPGAHNLYGHGFYTTDALDVATGYTKKGSGQEPTVYDVKWKGKNEPRLLDFDGEFPPDIAGRFDELRSKGGMYEYIPPNISGRPAKSVYAEMKEGMISDGIPAGEAEDFVFSIQREFSNLGYDGISHKGGGKGRQHNVVLYFNPKQLDVKEMKPNSDGGTVPPMTPKEFSGDEPGKYAGSINVKRFAPEDPETQQAFHEEMKAKGDYVDERGIGTTFDDIRERAAKVPQFTVDELRGITKEKPLDAVRSHALDNQYLGAREAAKSGDAEAVKLWNEYERAVNVNASAQGLALGARRIARIPELIAQRKLKDVALERLADIYGDGQVPPEAVRRLAKYADEDYNGLSKELFDMSRKKNGWLHAYLYGNMLSGPGTQVLNIGSNLSHITMDILAKSLAAPIDATVGAFTGNRTATAGQAAKYIGGMGLGLRRGLGVTGSTLKYGFSPQQAQTLDVVGRTGLPGGLANPINWGMRALKAVDEGMKTMVGTARINELAYVQAMKEGLDPSTFKARVAELTAKPTPEMQADAAAHGKKITFQDAMPQFLESLGKSLETPLPKGIPFVGKGSVAELKPGKLAMPFLRVVYNASKKMVEYSPAGQVRSVFTSNRNQSDQVKIASQTLVGSLPLLYLVPYAAEGNITVGPPTDKGEKELFYESGKKPYSVKIGNRWVDYRLFGPAAMAFATAGSMAEGSRLKKKEPTDSTALKAAVTLGRFMFEGSFLAGLNSAMKAISDPENFGEQFFANMGSQFMPMSAAQRFANNNGLDPLQRNRDTVGERIQSGTVLSQSLSPRLNSLGLPMKTKGMFPRSDLGDPVFVELNRLGITMPQPSRTVTIGTVRSPMTAEEYNSVAAAKQPLHKALKDLMNSAQYKAFNDGQKTQMINALKQRLGSRLSQMATSRVRAARQ